ncbi:hypothetical protein E2C01_046548 [Portunus trituberculatus]|uniref:Uncharacterized protein n=1 Tax=Portunus trituberculatus TaxID=210409 RepID=A0A5B7G1A5_PORTR|nr:hypothetical protein [Portunus trituberculatus]
MGHYPRSATRRYASHCSHAPSAAPTTALTDGTGAGGEQRLGGGSSRRGLDRRVDSARRVRRAEGGRPPSVLNKLWDARWLTRLPFLYPLADVRPQYQPTIETRMRHPGL